MITSTVLLDELEEVLERFVPKVVASEGRSAFEELAEVVEPNVIPQVSEDPNDDHVIAAALAGRADVVATRDGHLLSLGKHGGVVFMDRAACLAVFRDEA